MNNIIELEEQGQHRLKGEFTWVVVGNIAVCVSKTDEGVVVDLYRDSYEVGDVVATTYAFFEGDA